MVPESNSEAAEFAGAENRGGSGGVPRGKGDERPQGGERVQGALKGAHRHTRWRRRQLLGRETGGEGRRRRPLFLGNLRKKITMGGLFCNYKKVQGLKKCPT